MKLTTLIYLEDQEDWLMLLRNKKSQDINHDKWLGVGGKFEFGESPLECAAREVYEETGQPLENAQFQGFVTFHYTQSEPVLIIVYTGTIANREVRPNDEGEMHWIPKSRVLDLELWEGDRLFITAILEQEGLFDLKFYYNAQRELVKVEDRSKN